MLLKYIDETLIANRYDLKKTENVSVYLAESSLGEKLIEWNVVGNNNVEVKRDLLHYDDAVDGSNTLILSWQNFCERGVSLGEGLLYSGGNKYFRDGHSLFGGVAKAAIYLRYSEGFLQWLSTFDSVMAEQLREEKKEVICLFSGETELKLPSKWNNFKTKGLGEWGLPVVTSLSNGKRLVLWLNAQEENADWSVFDEWDVDIPHSLELMRFLTAPGAVSSVTDECDDLFATEKPQSRQQAIAEMFQMGSGMGRNCFGKTFKTADQVLDSEFVRLKGALLDSERANISDLWSNRLTYRVKVSPSPDTSYLLFLPEGKLKYTELKKFVENENDRVRQFWDEKKQKKKNTENGTNDTCVESPNAIPTYRRSMLFLVHEEGSQKKKVIVQQVIPSVELNYFHELNAFLMKSALQTSSTRYMKRALTCQDGADTPSVYRYWTMLFTHALQKRYISAAEVYSQMQRYFKGFKGDEMTAFNVGIPYFSLIEKLKALQQLIHRARNGNDSETPGVFEGMENMMSPQELVGEVFGLLREKQQSKLMRFMEQSRGAIPPPDFMIFVRGALVGMLLSELSYILKMEERRFTTTQGRHPSRLRGEDLIQVFIKGVGLLENLNKSYKFNCQTLPFIKSCQEESRKDAFNSGLIMGMVYFEPKNNETKENEQ